MRSSTQPILRCQRLHPSSPISHRSEVSAAGLRSATRSRSRSRAAAWAWCTACSIAPRATSARSSACASRTWRAARCTSRPSSASTRCWPASTIRASSACSSTASTRTDRTTRWSCSRARPAQAAPVPWREVCLQLRDVATSLSLLHARRLLHRDLSPGNVKLADDGHCKLLDFGALTDFGFATLDRRHAAAGAARGAARRHARPARRSVRARRARLLDC